METNLNQRQRLFVHNYAQGMGGRQAAIKAGYKSKNASVIASQNLRKLNIRRALDTLNDEAGITPSRLVSNLSSVLTQIKNIEFRASDYVKVMEFLLKLNGIYLKPPPSPRKHSRKRYDNNPGTNNFLLTNELFKIKHEPIIEEKPNELLTEPEGISNQVAEIKQAIPSMVKKAVPVPAPLRLVTPAYSGKGFSEQESVSFGSKISYPA